MDMAQREVGQQILAYAQQQAAAITAAGQQGAQMVAAAYQQAMAAIQAAMSGGGSTGMASGAVPGGIGATSIPVPGATAAPAPAPSPGLGGVPAPSGAPAAGATGGMAATVQAEFQSIVSAAQSGGTAAASAVQSAMTAIGTAMQSGTAEVQAGAQAMIAALQQIPAGVQAAAAAAAAAAATIGPGIAAGIRAGIPDVSAAAGEMAAAAQAPVVQAINPGSPSKWGIEMGQSIPEGLALGMEQKSPEVIAAAKKLGYAVEGGLAPLMDSVSMTGQAAANALGLDMEQLLAEKVLGMEGWDPKSQVDSAAMMAFGDAAKKMAKYGKRSGDQAAIKAGEAFQGLADNMSAVLAGTETYLSDELAKQALMQYRRLDADAKSKLPDDLKQQLKETYDEANITIGDVISQRMGQAGFEKGAGAGIGAMFKERKEMILRGMLGQRTLEQKAQAAAEDGLGLAIDAIKQGLMSAAPSAEGAAESAMKQALGGIGGAGGAMGAGGPMGGASPEEFAWALCECISGANQEMLGSLGLGNPAETGVAMLGQDLSNQIAGTGNDFRDAMLAYADANPALNLPKEFLGDDSASCMNICDRAASEMGNAAGDAAGAAMGAGMPAMPTGADIGGAAGAAMGDGLKQQCVSLCGGSVDDMASGVAGGVNEGLGDMAIKDAALNMSTGGARELGKQLRGGIPGAELPEMPGASPDALAGGVADGITSQCISLCDDSGMGQAASDMGSAAQDMGGQIEQLTNSMIGQKFNETLSGIASGLGGGGGGGAGQPGIPDDVTVPPLIHKLNPNINRALQFDLATTNPHAAALMSGLGGVPGALQPAIPSGAKLTGGPLAGGGGTPIQINTTVELDGQAVGRSVMNTMVPKLGMAAQNMRRGSSMTSRA